MHSGNGPHEKMTVERSTTATGTVWIAPVRSVGKYDRAMMAQRTGLEIALMIIVGVVLLLAALTAADRRGWIRLRASGKGSATMGLAAMDDVFHPSASQARHVLQEQKRMGQRAPTPGDWLDDEPSVKGKCAGKPALSVNRSQTADAPEDPDVIASRD